MLLNQDPSNKGKDLDNQTHQSKLRLIFKALKTIYQQLLLAFKNSQVEKLTYVFKTKYGCKKQKKSNIFEFKTNHIEV